MKGSDDDGDDGEYVRGAVMGAAHMSSMFEGDISPQIVLGVAAFQSHISATTPTHPFTRPGRVDLSPSQAYSAPPHVHSKRQTRVVFGSIFSAS